MRRMARKLFADRPPRHVLLLRSIHPYRRLDVQPARGLLKAASAIGWRRPIASLTYLLSSHVWRQDHNGASHQDPGFIDHVLNKKAEIVRVYLPPDANTLLAITDHCLRGRNKINVIVAGKHPEAQWLDMEAAIEHCEAGIGVWEWASNDRDDSADVVLASAEMWRRSRRWRWCRCCANIFRCCACASSMSST